MCERSIFGDDGLRAHGARRAALAWPRPRVLRKMRANLLRLVRFQRAGVGLAASHAEFRENVENRAALDFQLARQIVDTNLTHPPLFKTCAAKTPLVAHSYLMALAALELPLLIAWLSSERAHLTRRPCLPPRSLLLPVLLPLPHRRRVHLQPPILLRSRSGFRRLLRPQPRRLRRQLQFLRLRPGRDAAFRFLQHFGRVLRLGFCRCQSGFRGQRLLPQPSADSAASLGRAPPSPSSKWPK